MTRLQTVVVVVTVLAATLVGFVWSSQPFVAVLLSLLLAAGLGWMLSMSITRRLRSVVARARTLVPDEPTEGNRPHRREKAGAVGKTGAAGSWAETVDQLEQARITLSRRMQEVTAQRARAFDVLDVLPPPVLLFTTAGLNYANSAARELFRLDGDAPTAFGSATPMQALGLGTLADAVERTFDDGVDQEVEVTQGGKTFFARTSRTTQGEVALVLTDLTEVRQVDAVRRDFVTNASHELKTPVAGIQALADSLAMAVASDPQRATRMIGRIQTEASRLATLVRELLDLARVEELISTPASARVDVAEVVQTRLERMRHVAQERNVSVNHKLAARALVHASVEDVRMVVDNLLQNAVRYNQPGGSINVAVTTTDDVVVLKVADTGIGIPEADRERIFERFYRVDKVRSRAAGGTGLGLSLVRHAVARMGGTVSVMSALGEGSEFTVTLPANGEGSSVR